MARIKQKIARVLNSADSPRGRISPVEARNILGEAENAVETGKTTWSELETTPEELREAIQKINQRGMRKNRKKAGLRP